MLKSLTIQRYVTYKYFQNFKYDYNMLCGFYSFSSCKYYCADLIGIFQTKFFDSINKVMGMPLAFGS